MLSFYTNLVCAIGLGTSLVRFVIAPRFGEPITTLPHQPDESAERSQTASADSHAKGLENNHASLPSFQRLPSTSWNPYDNYDVSGSLESLIPKTYDQAEYQLPAFLTHSQNEHHPNDHRSALPSAFYSSHSKHPYQPHVFCPTQPQVPDNFAFDPFPDTLFSQYSHPAPKRLRGTANDGLAEISYAVRKDFSTRDPLSGLEGYSPWPGSNGELHPEQHQSAESVDGRQREESLPRARDESQHSGDYDQINHGQINNRQAPDLAHLSLNSHPLRRLQPQSNTDNQLQSRRKSNFLPSSVLTTHEIEKPRQTFLDSNLHNRDLYADSPASTPSTTNPSSSHTEPSQHKEIYSHRQQLANRLVSKDSPSLQPLSGYSGEELSGLTSEEVQAETPQHNHEDLSAFQNLPYFREELPHNRLDRQLSASEQQRPPRNAAQQSENFKTHESFHSTQKSIDPTSDNEIPTYVILEKWPRIPQTLQNRFPSDLITEITPFLLVPKNRHPSIKPRGISIGSIFVKYIPLEPSSSYPIDHGFIQLMQTKNHPARVNLIKGRLQLLFNCIFYYHQAWLNEMREVPGSKGQKKSQTQQDLFEWLRKTFLFPEDSFPVLGYTLPRTDSEDFFGESQRLILKYLLTQNIVPEKMRDPTAIDLIHIFYREKQDKTLHFQEETLFKKTLVEAIKSFNLMQIKRKNLEAIEKNIAKRPERSTPRHFILDTSADAFLAETEKRKT